MDTQQPLKMYCVEIGLERKRAGKKWVNAPVPADQPLPAGHIPDHGNYGQGVGSGFWEMETPIFEVSKRHGPRVPLLDVEPLGRGLWLVSENCKRVLERVDPEAFEFLKVETRIERAGEFISGPQYWLCDVIRFLDALDEAKTRGVTVKIYPGGIKRVEIRGRDKQVFFRRSIGNAKVFRLLHAPWGVYVTAELVDAVRAEGITNFDFDPAGSAV